MAPQLDLKHSTHAKMMVAPSRINLRRTASYNHHERASGVSSTSSRFNFNHLLYSPPPSPSLPSLVPRKRSSSIKKIVARPRRLLRTILYLSAFLALVYTTVYLLQAMFGYHGYEHHHEEFEMVGQDELPDFPTPIVVTDEHGQSKWTVSIPHGHAFPLEPAQYADMLEHCREASLRSKGLNPEVRPSGQARMDDMVASGSSKPDGNFIDVSEAEKAGMLPSIHKLVLSEEGRGHFVGAKQLAGETVCEGSITYVLESSDAGLGQAVMRMWAVYGAARALGKTFFLDDSRWGYGSYGDIFQPPPAPDCRAPPRHHMLPCPAEARHLVVSSVNANQMLPALVAQLDPEGKTSNSERQFLELAQAGYQDLFKLNSDDQDYVDSRVRDLRLKASAAHTKIPPSPIIGLHVRHGDRHPFEFQYRDTYIPAEVYLSKVQQLVDEQLSTEIHGQHDTETSVTLLASDDPMTHDEAEFTSFIPAQERIQLASKEAIDDSGQDPHFLHSFVDESFGWEGGFFAPMFWNLGQKTRNNAGDGPVGASPTDADFKNPVKTGPSDQTLRLRSLIGRAYMMDLAVLAGASDKVVCAVSAMGCRLLGVMMGWEEGIIGGRWVNVDGEYSWMGFDG